ncbi:MAG TPA: hypothetical protein VKI99_22870 [Candidatus Dormibacteraeota bacterium]|nr:hypothetical protein [Candidatus Dormibacteraeota bacterium]
MNCADRHNCANSGHEVGQLIAIEQAFEHLFGRDVDLILEATARPRVRTAIEREGVELLP